jgi:hypothetical protein
MMPPINLWQTDGKISEREDKNDPVKPGLEEKNTEFPLQRNIFSEENEKDG